MIRRFCAAAIIGFSALAVTSAPASAATGQLVLRGASTVVIPNPPPGCRTVSSGFSAVLNRTNVTVVAFSAANCFGSSVVVAPSDQFVPVGFSLSVRVPV
jgi:hypothetical protein